MTHIDAMKQGLEALEVEDMACRYEKEATPEYIAKAITSLRQAIAKAEKENALQSLHAENERLGLYKDAYAEQEPVAWMYVNIDGECEDIGYGKTYLAGLDGCTPLYTHPPQRTEQEPVAWRTFDGEGGYDYRTYDTNEDYADEWEKRNPNHKGWVEPLYKDPKPCPTCEALARTVMLDQTSHDTRPQPQRTEQETVIDKSAAIRIATALGWEPKREWVGLTDEEIDDLAEFHGLDFMSYAPFTRAIEAKLKDKNGYAEENT